MDHDDKTIGRIFTRREALRAGALAGFGWAAMGLQRVARAGLNPTTQKAADLVASPSLTEGPFFVDEKLNRSDLVSGAKRKAVIEGLPLQLMFTVYKLTDKVYAPLPGAQVDVWHADTAGVYSDEDNPMNAEVTSNQKWLRGFQMTDPKGAAGFTTIFPGWYSGRTPHIHFKIRQRSTDGKTTAEFTSQFFFHPADLKTIYAKPPYSDRGMHDTDNENDDVYGEQLNDGSAAGSHLLLDLKPNETGNGHVSEFSILLTDQNTRVGDHRGPQGPGEPGGPPPGGPPGNRPGGPPGGFGPPPWDW